MKKRALISVYNKDKIVDFARELVNKYNYEILSTGGTARLLKENNISVVEVSELTKFPEMLEGRVKTLHPAIHGGLLARRDKKDHMKTISDLGIQPIDLVVINLYPFDEVIKNPKSSFEDAIENIDIGGPSMIRSAAKNFSSVTVVSDASDLSLVLNELKTNNGETTLAFREKLAAKAFKKTNKYDEAISNYLSNKTRLDNGQEVNNDFPETLKLNLKLKKSLRYGENPHQKAALYVDFDSSCGLANAEVFQGKELSFNNYLDLESSWNIASEFTMETPVAVIVKHNTPCGAAIAPNLLHAYLEALNCDPISAFGGIVAFNNKVEKELAEELTKNFLEAIVAPDFSDDALQILKNKKNLRVLKVKPDSNESNKKDIKRISHGYLMQDFNNQILNEKSLKVVTKRKPSEQELIDLIFGWKIVKHVKSNAIVIAKDGKTLGIGGGQTSRVASVEIAVNQANYLTKNAVLASDAFFPFKDSIEIAASAEICAIIQPGGSKKDPEVIEACDKYNIAMLFTGIRHFRH